MKVEKIVLSCIQKLWKYFIYLEISKVKDSSVYAYQKCH